MHLWVPKPLLCCPDFTAEVQLEKHQFLLLFTNKHRGPEPSSSCQCCSSSSLPCSSPSLSGPRRWIGTPRSLQFNMFKIQGSFLCLSPFLINFWVPVFMFSISLSKTDSWAVHLLLQQSWSWRTTRTSHFFNHLKNDGSATQLWAITELDSEHLNNKRDWDSYTQWIFIIAKPHSNPV